MSIQSVKGVVKSDMLRMSDDADWVVFWTLRFIRAQFERDESRQEHLKTQARVLQLEKEIAILTGEER